MSRRRRTPAESDALVAHLSHAQKRRAVAEILAVLRMRGVDAVEIFDAAGRSFIKVDVDQVREKLGEDIARQLQQVADEGPLPQGHAPPAA